MHDLSLLPFFLNHPTSLISLCVCSVMILRKLWNCRWECLKDLLLGDWTDGIVCSFGMPVIKGSERYNCQVFCLNRKIIMIRPKMSLANDGNYRELRWFTAWKQRDQLVDFQLPPEFSQAIGQNSVPFGYGFIKFQDT